MIVTITMNPAIDKTVDIDRLERGGLHRVRHVELDAGGKGINASKAIAALGGRSIATGFLAGNSGEMIRNVMDEWKIENDFIEISGETRTNTKIVEATGVLTELNEAGPLVTEEEIEALMKKLDGYAACDTIFILAGSIPEGIKKNIYCRIIQRLHKKGARVILDADGALFAEALQARPDVVKPNHIELAQYAGMTADASEQELYRAAEQLMEKGIGAVAVSMGKDGAIFLLGDYRVRCHGLRVKTHSTVGAGDAMVAALAYAMDRGMKPEETVKLCMAVSAGAAATVGTKPPTGEMIDTLLAQVEVTPVDGSFAETGREMWK